MRLLVQLVLSILLASPAWATIARVQKADAYPGNSVSLTGTTAGNFLVVGASWADTTSDPTVSDTASNTWSALPVLGGPTGQAAVSIKLFYAMNIKGGNTTITLSSSPVDVGIHAVEYSGVATGTALDVTSTAAASSGTTTPTSGSFTPTAGDLIYAYFGDEGTAQSTISGGTSYTIVTATGNHVDASEDNLSAAGGAQTASFSLGTTTYSWALYVATFKASGTSATPNCGIVDNGSTIYTPQNYTTFVPPAKMGTYSDPSFNCTVLRLTDGQTDFGTNTGHNYIRSAFNSNDTTFLVYQNGPGTFYAVDVATGAVLVAPGQFVFSGGAADETWDRTNPNIIYYEVYNGNNSNQLWKADISACTLSNPCDGAHGTSVANTLIHTFSEYTSLDNNNNKRDISDDGCYLAMGGVYTSGGIQRMDAFWYNLCTNTKSAAVQTCPTSMATHFNSGMTYSDRMWVAWGGSGTGGCQGTWLFDINMNVIGQLYTATPHNTAVYDPAANKEYIVFEASGDASNEVCGSPSGSTSGIGKIETDVPPPFPKTCIVSFPYNLGDVHVSSNNALGWFAAEMGDTTGSVLCPIGSSSTSCTANDNSTLPSNWNSTNVWGRLYNEIVAVNISTGQVYRLAHGRSRLTGATNCGGYWTDPRLSMDFGGTRIAFDSSMARTNSPLPACIQDYVDTYIIKFR